MWQFLGRKPRASRTVEFGRVNLGADARARRILCLSGARFLGCISQHPVYSALCVYPPSTRENSRRILSAKN